MAINAPRHQGAALSAAKARPETRATAQSVGQLDKLDKIVNIYIYICVRYFVKFKSCWDHLLRSVAGMICSFNYYSWEQTKQTRCHRGPAPSSKMRLINCCKQHLKLLKSDLDGTSLFVCLFVCPFGWVAAQCDPPSRLTFATHPRDPSSRPTLATLLRATHPRELPRATHSARPTVSNLPRDLHSRPTLTTHPRDPPSRPTLATHPRNPPRASPSRPA